MYASLSLWRSQDLNKEHGTTILISSHLLGELDQLATCYGFIHKGKIIEQITAKEILEKSKTLEQYYMTILKGIRGGKNEKFDKG